MSIDTSFHSFDLKTTEAGSLVTPILDSKASRDAWHTIYKAASVLAMCDDYRDSTVLNRCSHVFLEAAKKIRRDNGNYEYMPAEICEKIRAIVALVTPKANGLIYGIDHTTGTREIQGYTQGYTKVKRWGEAGIALVEALQAINPKKL